MSAESLQVQASCSICLEFFQDPVSIHCGHSFCRACITRCWKGLTTNFSCPQCREMIPQQSLRPNWELANLTEEAKKLSLQAVKVLEEGDNLCQAHQESLKLFCEEEQSLICVVCDRSKAHRSHFVVPVEEAAQEYKERIQIQLQALKEEQANLQDFVKAGEDRVQDYTKRSEGEKQKILSTFAQIRKVLDEKEACLLSQLESVCMDIQESEKKTLDRLSEELSSMGTLIGEMERKCQQPGCELLKDIKNTLSRWERENFSQSLKISPESEGKFSDFTSKTADFSNIVENFKEEMEHILPSTTQVTLDPDTANANLYLSDDCRDVWWEECKQRVPSNPRRFVGQPCVLGSTGFTSGQHRWEVQVCRQGVWAIGVAKQSVPRRGLISLSPKEGIWALQHHEGQRHAPVFSFFTHLRLPKAPRLIQVTLDYQEGRVEFFDAVTAQKILGFPPASFKGEKIYPFFLVQGDTHLKILH